MSDMKFTTPWLQHWREKEHTETFLTTLNTIEQHAWQVLTIKGEPSSRFAYTIGAYDTLGVPELIVIGLTEQTAHRALNYAVEAMREGKDLTVGRHRDIVGEVEVEFHPVDSKWKEHVMCRAHWYYNGSQFPALQLVYPDLEGRFQNEEGFTEYFHQPMLSPGIEDSQREKDFWALNDPGSALFNWKFDDPPHTRVYLSETVQKKEEAVTYVSHDASDGAWQFLGDKMADGGGPVISCFHHPIDDDRTLEELHDMPLGWYAVRDKPGDSWQRFQKEPDDND
jgi:hypothetical protein